MYIDMINIEGFSSYDVSSLRAAVTGGATCPIELIKEIKVKLTVERMISLYGQTETSPVIYQTLPEDSDLLQTTTVGYPLEHMEVKVIDAEGNIVPVGTKGEMCTRGYLVMPGYWDDPQKTAETIDPERWLHTG